MLDYLSLYFNFQFNSISKELHSKNKFLLQNYQKDYCLEIVIDKIFVYP